MCVLMSKCCSIYHPQLSYCEGARIYRPARHRKCKAIQRFIHPSAFDQKFQLKCASQSLHFSDFEGAPQNDEGGERSEEHTSELQSLMRISYAVFCLQTKRNKPPYREQT